MHGIRTARCLRGVKRGILQRARGARLVVCFPFPGSIIPPSRLDPFWLQAIRQLPAPTATTPTSPNAIAQFSGKLNGSRLIIDGQNNTALSKFGGIAQVPYGPFNKGAARFTLYVDGRVVSSKDFFYDVAHR